MKVDWKQRYDKLTVLTNDFLEKYRQLDFLARKIKNHVEESDALALREQGKHRYLRLKEDILLIPEYNNGKTLGVIRKFVAGTLIEARISGNVASVYLDEDGDGLLYFPADKLEQVELLDSEINWDMVVSQG